SARTPSPTSGRRRRAMHPHRPRCPPAPTATPRSTAPPHPPAPHRHGTGCRPVPAPRAPRGCAAGCSQCAVQDVAEVPLDGGGLGVQQVVDPHGAATPVRAAVDRDATETAAGSPAAADLGADL